MSTRAVYTFLKAGENERHVYKHHDGYPTQAVLFIKAALPYAWELPRFEPDDFAAAFIAGNKQKGGGGVYITSSPKDHGDLEFRYEISSKDKDIIITAYAVTSNEKSIEIFQGTLSKFLDESLEIENSLDKLILPDQ